MTVKGQGVLELRGATGQALALEAGDREVSDIGNLFCLNPETRFC